MSLGGIRDVTKNMYIYEYGDDILIVDCGLGFPDSEMLGVDVVIPDVSYLEKNREKVKGILITHGHEDHIGALPYILPKLNVPVFAAPLPAGFIRAKMEEQDGSLSFKINIIDVEKGPFSIGSFKVNPFRINHSVPDAMGYCIETPQGKIFHVADFKFDFTPVDGKPFEIAKVVELASSGVLVLASDCLGSNSEGFTRSEAAIEKVFEEIIGSASGQVIVTTVSSNISRMQQAINASVRHGRKIVLAGRSIVKNIEIAKSLGYLKVANKDLVRVERSENLDQRTLTYIVAGAYGQQSSALSRIANGTHKFATLRKHATVIFSADPAPPGVKDSVDSVIDKLTELGADVHYYEIQEDLHVSGHGSQGDIKLLTSLVRPKYFLPIGGTARHLHSFAKLVESLGYPYDNVLQLDTGIPVEFDEGKATVGKSIPVSEILIDSSGTEDIGEIVIKDRQTLSREGIIIVSVPLKRGDFRRVGETEVMTRGFSRERLSDDIVKIIRDQVDGTLAQMRERATDRHQLRYQLERVIFRFLTKRTMSRPMVLPIIVEI
jgi:ribonuclease J